MKKQILYIAAIAFIGITAGCKKFLDIVPVGSVIPTTIPELNDELNSAYVLSIRDKGVATWRSDEVMIDASASSFSRERVKNPFVWDDYGSASSVTYEWRNQYSSLFYANHIIEAAPKANGGSEAEKNQLLGEGYLLRAYAHFNLVNLYGAAYNEATAATDKAVPLSVGIDLERVSPRNTVKEVYQQVLSDLEQGRKLVNVQSFETARSFKFTTTAADALASRIYLYTNNWNMALDAAKAALAKKNTLVDLNQANATLPNLYNSNENIMAYELMFNFDLLRVLNVSDLLRSKYDAQNDLRYKAYFVDTKGKLTVAKQGTDTKFRSSFRVGELYLNAAEAASHLNKDADARTYLNTLKKARLTPAFYAQEETRINGLSGAALLTEILDERFRELAFEGHRWFDLRRTTQPTISHLYDKKTYDLKQNDPRYTIQIPLEAIAANPLLRD